ncbi:MAG: GxxExxY protein [Kofleriaceae bacterium]
MNTDNKLVSNLHHNLSRRASISNAFECAEAISNEAMLERFGEVIAPNQHRPAKPRQADRSADGIHAELSYAIIGAAIEVHRHIGPGQYESVYENSLRDELRSRGLSCRQQVGITALYKGKPVGLYRADIIVEQKVVIELKSVERISVAHRMQVLTYLRASGLRLGLVMNFNSEVLWREIKRVVL